MAKQRGATKLRRRGRNIEPRRKMLICCGGEVTEPCYFKDFRRHNKSQLVDIEIFKSGYVPKTLVEYAVERKKDAEKQARRTGDATEKYDDVWCVVDVDYHPHLPDARQQARDNGIHLAVSNPCFELWALLHFQDQGAHIDTPHAQAALKQHLLSYVKHLPFDLVHVGYVRAVHRASDIEGARERAGVPGGNPSTGVYRLTEKIREASRDAQIERLRSKRV